MATEEEIKVKIEAIQAKLAELVTNPQVDYKLGDKTVSASQYQEQLLKQLEYWEKKLKEVTITEDISSVETGTDQFGKDKSDYQGED